ncbi:MAG: 1,4-dihydroxy-2-naphthoate polyprenyltransferase [Anaerolineales bacterium]
MAQSIQSATPLQAWIAAARPRTLPASAAPVLAATALALRNGAFHLPSALACLLISLLMQIVANFANDLFDHEHGVDTNARLGPTRVIAAGLIAPRQMRRAILLTLAFTCLLGLFLALRGGWPVILLGLAIILAALLYSGGPKPYGYYALGDLFVFLCFGVAAVCGTYYVQALTLPLSAWWVSAPIGLLIVNILVVNNTRDISTDKATNKRTLAVLLGRKAMLLEYLACIAAAYLTPLGLWIFGLIPVGGLLSWISLPWAVILFRRFSQSDGRSLNKTLADTAQLAFIYTVLFSIGILIMR